MEKKNVLEKIVERFWSSKHKEYLHCLGEEINVNLSKVR